MGLAEILAFLAFGIALITLWLTSDVIKKVELQNEKLIKTHLHPLREDLAALADRLERLARVTTLNEAQLKQIKADSAARAATFETQLNDIAEEVRRLDESIPKQYRTPTAARGPSIQ